MTAGTGEARPLRLGRRPSPVTVANERVSISYACALIGLDLPGEVYGRSVKLRCPFAELYHSDGGAEASFRVYPESNHAYCFTCATAYSPVWLVAQAWGLTARAAAVELLERAGIKPVHLADAWAHAAQRATAPDAALLAEALKTYCARVHPGWADAQFDPAVAGTLSACLALLDRVGDDVQAQQWLTGCKQAMAAALGVRTGPCPR